MRPVDHSAVHRKDASVGLCLERGDDGGGVADIALGGCESGVEDVDLTGMDGELAGEALAARGFRFGAQAGFVTEVGEDSVDRLDSCRDCAGEAERAGKPIGEGEVAVCVVF